MPALYTGCLQCAISLFRPTVLSSSVLHPFHQFSIVQSFNFSLKRKFNPRELKINSDYPIRVCRRPSYSHLHHRSRKGTLTAEANSVTATTNLDSVAQHWSPGSALQGGELRAVSMLPSLMGIMIGTRYSGHVSLPVNLNIYIRHAGVALVALAMLKLHLSADQGPTPCCLGLGTKS